jgi:hypothetical protein
MGEPMASAANTFTAYIDGKDPIAMQREFPAILAGLLSGVDTAKLTARPVPGKWSVTEIVAHLAEDELTSSWRYRQMIENPGVELAGFDQDLWAQVGAYNSWPAADALQMFRLLREANLRMMAQLTPKQWECYGTHAERGRITVRSLVRHMAGHDRSHLDQILRILANA